MMRHPFHEVVRPAGSAAADDVARHDAQRLSIGRRSFFTRIAAGAAGVVALLSGYSADAWAANGRTRRSVKGNRGGYRSAADYTTLAAGEEGGESPGPPPNDILWTTLLLGEEGGHGGGTTLILGEEG
jgi:hypothetical protein